MTPVSASAYAPLLTDLGSNTAALDTTLATLETGNALANPATNPADSMIATLLIGQLGMLTQAQSNLLSGLDWLNTQSGALQSQLQLIQQAEVLATQAANGTLTAQDRATLQTQLDGLLSGIDAAAGTTYNGLSLRAQSAVVYQSGSTSVITSITGGAGDPQGTYSVDMTPESNGMLTATLIHNGTAVASTAMINPYPNATMEPAYPGGPDTVPVSWFPIGSEATLAPGESSDLGSPQDAITYSNTWNSPDPIVTIQLAAPQTLSGIYMSSYDIGGSIWKVQAFGTPVGASGFTSISPEMTIPSSNYSVNYAMAVTPNTYTALQLNFSQSAGNTQFDYGGIGAVIAPTVSLQLTWNHADAGYGAPITVDYNPTDLTTGTPVGSGPFAIVPSTINVQNATQGVALQPSLLNTQELGIQSLSIDTQDQAQQAMQQLQDAAQVISGLQTTTGASVEQLQAALQNAESTAAQTTASAATVSSADLPQVTVALARQQWLAQSGLQVLTQARTLQQRTAQTLATIVS